jgi:dTDP-4-amino-4,6-dideoxygalactose transaminase
MTPPSTSHAPIPIMRLDRQYSELQEAFEHAALSVMRSGVYILGPNVTALEAELAQRVGCAHGIGVANGTDSLYLCLRALGIGHGDEVITTPMSYIATSEAIVRAGATPVFVDIVDDATYLIDINAVEAAITPRTKGIIPVHLYGQAVDMDALMAVARKHQLAVVEDCAQAIDATWNGQAVGSFGDMGSFSFFPTKNLGAFGDGGMITCHNEAHNTRLRQIRVHGQTSSYDHTHEGMNSRLDELQAALVRVKLPHLHRWAKRRAELARVYIEALAPIKCLLLPHVQGEAGHVFHQFTIAVKEEAPLNRDALVEALNAEGIGVRVYYPIPLHLQGMHKALGYTAGQLPIAERACKQVLSLPMFPEMDASEQARVIETLQRLLHVK